MRAYKNKLKRIVPGIIIAFVVLLAVTVVSFWSMTRDLPAIFSLKDYHPLGVTQLILKDHEGNETVLSEFYKERRYLVGYKDIPKVVIDAFISAEDDTFFQHEGVSYLSILRAAVANFRAGHVVQGGSTITQQVAKSLFFNFRARNF